jgi:hypothetical protein
MVVAGGHLTVPPNVGSPHCARGIRWLRRALSPYRVPRDSVYHLCSATATVSGTSIAAALVAGAAARLLGEQPGLTPAQVMDTLVCLGLNGTLASVPVGTINRLLNGGVGRAAASAASAAVAGVPAVTVSAPVSVGCKCCSQRSRAVPAVVACGLCSAQSWQREVHKPLPRRVLLQRHHGVHSVSHRLRCNAVSRVSVRPSTLVYAALPHVCARAMPWPCTAHSPPWLNPRLSPLRSFACVLVAC